MSPRRIRKLRDKLSKYLEKRRFDQAIEVYSQLSAIESKEPRWPHKQGDLLRRLKRDDEAVAAYERAVHRYAEKGFVARAVAMAKVILTVDPTRADVLYLVDPEQARRLHRKHRRPSGLLPLEPLVDSVPPPTDPLPLQGSYEAEEAVPSSIPPAYPESQPAPSAEPLPTAAAPVAPAAPPEPTRTPEVPLPQLTSRSFELLAPVMDSAVEEDRFDDVDTINLELSDFEVARRDSDVDEDLDALLREAVGDEEPASPSDEPGIGAGFSTPADDWEDQGPEMDVDLDIDVELGPVDPASFVGEADELSADELALLPGLPLFAELPREAFVELGHHAELVGLDDGEIIFHRGEEADALYVIVAGGVRLSALEPGSGPSELLGEGDVFGEACLLADLLRTTDATVAGHLVALKLERTDLQELVAAYPRVGDVLLEMLTRRVIGALLATSAVFSGFDTDARKEVARLFQARRAPPGQILAQTDKRIDALYLLLDGRLAVEDTAGRYADHGPIALLGKASIVSAEPAMCTVRTLTEVFLLRLPAAAFHAVVASRPMVAMHLAELASDEEALGADMEAFG